MTMTAFPPPNISSFVIRFVVSNPAEPSPNQPVYHGTIRHIQSDEELNFSSWKDAEAFIRRFVPLEDERT
ncbi:MAG: hypothetical protein A2030_11870 [Chloroflexi bacterium RBG_19FT_COMBO_50_10]|nr:MAG: hypothetical protein A2030_11870 [Chloroflexi bacterium RBG_19FT_COMBO_50_10]